MIQHLAHGWILAGLSDGPASVRCDNCGNPWWIDLLTVVSAIVAGLAVLIALAALRHSRQMRDMMRAEHDAFLKELSKKPKLEISVNFRGGGEGIEIDTPDINTVIEVRVKNIGNKWIENAVVNVKLPELLWEQVYQPHTVNRFGAESPEIAMTTSEKLSDGAGGELPARLFHSSGDSYSPTVSVLHEFAVLVSPEKTPRIPVGVEITDTTGEEWKPPPTVLRVKRIDGSSLPGSS